MKKELVVKDNALINAAYTLDLAEQRLILLAIIEARESGKGINANNPLTVHAERYAKQFGVTRQAAYWALKEAASGLFERYFRYQSKDEENNLVEHKSRWVGEIQYIESGAAVGLIFTSSVVPLVTRLEQHFTSYELEQVSSLTSGYAIRLYELLIAWRSTGKTPIFEAVSFREQLGLGANEYKTMGDFKKRVLNLALAQINEHTDITAAYEQHKAGRMIVGFSFKFKHKKPKGTQTAKNTDDNTAKKKPRQTTTKTLRSRLEKSGIAL